MYQAELKSKLPQYLTRMEDILTSNVFSFFKYTNRIIFLKKFLRDLEFKLTDRQVKAAEFQFWPVLSKNTEPDLIIIVGDWYLLIEAKYHSGFGEKTKTRKSQLHREIEEGILEANNLDKQFKLIAITADYYFKPEKFTEIEEVNYIWTNWQRVATLLNNILETENNLTYSEKEFAGDLYDLLADKKLREYRGIKYMPHYDIDVYGSKQIFFKAETAQYRGSFIGFKESLSGAAYFNHIQEDIFLAREKE